MNDKAWTGLQLTLGLTAEAERPLPDAVTEALVDALQEILLLAGTAIARGAAQEAANED